jgi:hypothetical protein
MPIKQIALHNISCASALHDSCGVVFKYQGHVLRALSSRGERIVEVLQRDFNIDELAALGLVVPTASKFGAPGLKVAESECISPIIPPSFWTVEMVGQAALVIIRLSRALLKRGYVLWDLKGLQNMTFHFSRGALFLDIGAIHSLKELEENDLSTSYESLLQQILDAFYLPLWLATGNYHSKRFVRRLLNAKRLESESGIARGLISKLSFNGLIAPGYLRLKMYLSERDLESFYALLEHRVGIFLELHRKNNRQAVRTVLPQVLVREDNTNGLVSIIKSCGLVFDLEPDRPAWIEFSPIKWTGYYMIYDNLEWPEEPDSVHSKNPYVQYTVPLLCDIWDRSLRQLEPLRQVADLVIVMSDIYEFCAKKRIPIDFFGRIASYLGGRYLLLTVSPNSVSKVWPGFVANPDNVSPVEFVRQVIGKYFCLVMDVTIKQESGLSTILLFQKHSTEGRE